MSIISNQLRFSSAPRLQRLEAQAVSVSVVGCCHSIWSRTVHCLCKPLTEGGRGRCTGHSLHIKGAVVTPGAHDRASSKSQRVVAGLGGGWIWDK